MPRELPWSSCQQNLIALGTRGPSVDPDESMTTGHQTDVASADEWGSCRAKKFPRATTDLFLLADSASSCSQSSTIHGLRSPHAAGPKLLILPFHHSVQNVSDRVICPLWTQHRSHLNDVLLPERRLNSSQFALRLLDDEYTTVCHHPDIFLFKEHTGHCHLELCFFRSPRVFLVPAAGCSPQSTEREEKFRAFSPIGSCERWVNVLLPPHSERTGALSQCRSA